MKCMKKIVTSFLVLVLAACFAVPAWADSEYNTKQRDFEAEAYYDALEICAMQIRELTDFEPEYAVVLGSGLGDFVDQIEIVDEIPYSQISGFPESTAPGHEGTLVFGNYAGKKLVLLKGRIHYYEGYSMYDVVLPIRTMYMLGVKTVILTNAVGAINEDFNVGDFVVVEDHISSFVPSPLIGENIEELGTRFTDMTHVYDEEMREMVIQIGEEEGIPVHSGIYLQTTGPQFETPAEIRMYRGFGADVVGMSAAVEAIAARHMGMKVCSICTVTNMAAGMEDVELSHNDVYKTAEQSFAQFTQLVGTLLERLPDSTSDNDPEN